jgi:hypothetical protein
VSHVEFACGRQEGFSDSAGPYLIRDNKLIDTSVHCTESNSGQIIGNTLTRTSVFYRAISFGGVVSGNRFRDGSVTFDVSPQGVVENDRFDGGGVVDFFSEDVAVRDNWITGDPAAGVRVEIGLVGGIPPTGIDIAGNTLRRNGSQPAVAVDFAGRDINDGIERPARVRDHHYGQPHRAQCRLRHRGPARHGHRRWREQGSP